MKTKIWAVLGILSFISFKTVALEVNPLLASQNRTFVHIDRCPVDFQVPPVIVNNRTFVELSTLAEKLEIFITWNGATRQVTGMSVDGQRTFKLWIDSTIAEVNGQNVTLDAAPFIASEYGRTMIPLSFVAEATGSEVHWRNGPRTVDVFSGNTTECVIDQMHHLAEYVWRGYYEFGEAGPIAITKAELFDHDYQTKDIYLVGLSGTDMQAVWENGSATGIVEDYYVGFLNADNAFTSAVITTIINNIPPGSNLVFAGHSLGGMVAQQVINDSYIRAFYHVLNTVTFGSPLINLGFKEGDVRRMGDTIDIVPYLSIETLVNPPWAIYGLNKSNGHYLNPILAHNESYRRYDVWHEFDPLGFDGKSAIIYFNPENLQYFAAPRNP